MAKHLFALLLLMTGVAAGNPKQSAAVETVLQMLSEVGKKVTAEGEEEAETFRKLERFCKDTEEETSASIAEATEKMELMSGEISKLEASNAQLEADITQGKEEITEITADLKEKVDVRAKAASEYRTSSRDISAAVTGIDKAIDEMKAKKSASFLQKPSFKKAIGEMKAKKVASFLQQPSFKETVQNAALLAESLGLKTNGSLDLDDADTSYDGIVDMLEELQTQFRKNRDDSDVAAAKAVSSFQLEKQSLEVSLKNKKTSLATKHNEFAQNQKTIAVSKEELAESNSTRTQDSAYLAETNASCSEKKQIHEQHVSMRAEELAALSQATDIMKETTSSSSSSNGQSLLMEVAAETSQNQGLLLAAEAEASAIEREEKRSTQPALGFLQRQEVHRPRRHEGQLATDDGYSQERQTLVSILSSTAGRLHSQQLASLAQKAKTSPEFGPIKEMIQNMIAKLQKQMAESQTQKGYCDKETGAAELTRDEASRRITELNSELSSTQARKDSLEQELKELDATVSALDKKKDELVEIRAEEAKQTTETISEAKEALEGVQQAKQVITDFYSSASQKTALLQKPDQAYKGDQGSSKGIIGILEVIESDFQRSISDSKSSEDDAVKEQKKLLNDMAVTKAEKLKAIDVKSKFKDDAELKLTSGTSDLKAETSRLESALLELKMLEEKCGIGATYADRKAKRDEEMKALEEAISSLDGFATLR